MALDANAKGALTCQLPQTLVIALPQVCRYISKNSRGKMKNLKLKVVIQTVTHVVPTVKGMKQKSLQTMTT